MPDTEDRAIVEIEVLTEVYWAACARARAEDVPLAAVSRQIIYSASRKVTPEEGKALVIRTAKRPRKSTCKRVRLTANRDEYQAARDRIRAAGWSVAAVLEMGLENYARKGTFTSVKGVNTDAPAAPQEPRKSEPGKSRSGGRARVHAE